LWAPYHLWGAIVAWGIAEVVYQGLGLLVLLRRMPFPFSFIPTYIAFLSVIGLAALSAAYLARQNLLISAVVWLALVGGFFIAAGYSWSEIRRLTLMVLPAKITQIVFT
jgi:cell division protein FtsW (lipid II flippase)